jgi:hypothetical protein
MCAAGELFRSARKRLLMSDAPKKLAPWRNLVFLVVLLFGWAGYRLYRDHQAGGWEESSINATAITLCIGLLIAVGVFWYANRPEREEKP